MAEGGEVEMKKPLQQGVEDSVLGGYYDIMVIGRTGMGKSTTVDKLLIANITGQNNQDQQDRGPAVEDGKLKHEHMWMWLISESDDKLERVTKRLKNLVFSSNVDNSHKEVDQFYKEYSDTTSTCELLSNELTKIRVLDVPGFFGQNATCAGNVETQAKKVNDTDLGIMRKVLHIKSANNMVIRRIVYFLPDRGALQRTSANLILEIGIMAKYFGHAIFDSMVVVATYSPDVYKFMKEISNRDLFPHDDLEQTCKHLKEALQTSFKEDIPDPPIVFISLFDTCEDILLKVQRAEVKEDRVNLVFSNSICARCGSRIILEGEKNMPSAVIYPGEQGAVPYSESTCHPMMIPKYTEVQKFIGGILHLITLFQFPGWWPSLANTDEICTHCGKAPRSRGCRKVGSKHFFTRERNSGVIVDHSSDVNEQYEIV